MFFIVLYRALVKREESLTFGTPKKVLMLGRGIIVRVMFPRE